MSQMSDVVRSHEQGGPEVLRLEQLEVGPPGPGEVQIRQRAVGLNFIDVYVRSGVYKVPSLPTGLGQEAAGEVVAVGAGVSGVRRGDRVAYLQVPFGAYASLRNVAAEMVVVLPGYIDDQAAAATMVKGLTVQYLFRQTYRLQGHETILFHAAAGGVGLIACQWARALGVKLIGTVSSPEKAALAKAHGAWATIDYSRENIVERVLELTGGKKLPVVYDSVGKDTWLASLDCLETRGLMVSYGNASGPVTGVDLGILAAKGSLFVTRPTVLHHVTPRAKFEAAASEFFDMVRRRKIKIEVARSYALKDAAQAHIDLTSRKTTGSSILIP